MFYLLQGTPLSGQELRDAHAVPRSASTSGSGGLVGEKRQSEVSCLSYVHVFVCSLCQHVGGVCSG